MELIGQAYDWLLTGAVILLAVLIICSVVRSVLGPRIADRIIAVNMVGTMIIMIIAILSVYLEENYLVDVCLIYAMISFLGVVVLCKVYTGVYLQKKRLHADMNAIEENLRRQQMADGGAGYGSPAEYGSQEGYGDQEGYDSQDGYDGQEEHDSRPADRCEMAQDRGEMPSR